MLQYGADLTNRTAPAGQSALTFYTNFSKVDRVWDETLPASITDFENGQLAMYFGRYEDSYKIKKQNPSLHFAVVPVPQLPANGSPIPSISYANYWPNGVFNSSLRQPAACPFS